MGNDIADYNNDGQPDVVTVDMLPQDEKTLKTYGSEENSEIYKYKIKIMVFKISIREIVCNTIMAMASVLVKQVY